MPPTRWGAVNRGPASPSAELTEYILKEISSNNCLGLEREEMAGMAKELLDSKTRAEVYEWSNTLIMGEGFAAEVIKRRADYGPAFEGETPLRVQGASLSGAAVLGALHGSSNPASGKQGGAVHAKVSKKSGKKSININKLQSQIGINGGDLSGALKAGFFECGCFGTIHNARTNCANCGRIVCEQEADDVCYFCGLDPSRCIADEIAAQEGKLTEAAQQRNQQDYEAAVARRDKLLEYAQNRARRTAVVDDQAETLLSPQSAWLSPQERAQAQKDAVSDYRRARVEAMLKHRGVYQVDIDFANKTMVPNVKLDDCEVGKDTESVDNPSENKKAPDGDSDGGDEWKDGAEVGEEEEDAGPTVGAGATALPTLLQKIWYNPDGSGVTDKGAAESSPSEADNATTTALPRSRPMVEMSRRVQQTYFEDDVSVFMDQMREGARAELVFDPQRLLSTEMQGSHEAANVEEQASGQSAAFPPTEGALHVSSALPVASPSVGLADRFTITQAMRVTDDSVCLSMHQPWASLLVAGIKTHEGRVWSTTYRGRLWIHAASAQPMDIAEVEQHYSQFISPTQCFPKHYPTKVLLGYVYLVDCLDKEAYDETFRAEQRQEECPFSFICMGPKSLVFPLPMSGGHKLFTLENKVHVAALKQLQELAS